MQMKNFWQFMLPIIIILLVGTFMIIKTSPATNEKKLYIKCNNISINEDVYSGKIFTFAEKDENCKLEVEVLDVNDKYIKINTKYLSSLNISGEVDEDKEPARDNIIPYNEKTILYSYNDEGKYIFQYK